MKLLRRISAFVKGENLNTFKGVKFDPAKNPVNPDVRIPSISVMVQMARQTGSVPFGNQRVPIPCATNDIDAPVLSSDDAIGDNMLAHSIKSSYEDLYGAYKKELDAENERKLKEKEPPKPPAPPTE